MEEIFDSQAEYIHMEGEKLNSISQAREEEEERYPEHLESSCELSPVLSQGKKARTGGLMMLLWKLILRMWHPV